MITMSRIIALLGLALFAYALVSGLRFPLFAKWLGSLARQFRFHHWIGIAAGASILSHVGLELLTPTWSVARTLIFTRDPGLLAGWCALLLCSTALFLSYNRTFRYKKWYIFHMLFPLGFLLAVIHAYTYRTPYNLDETLIFVSAILGAISITAIVINKFWNPLSVNLRVAAIKRFNESTWEVLLSSPGIKQVPQRFKAGDIVYIRFLQSGFTHKLHPFTIASCRFEPHIRLYIKNLGRDTSHIQDLAIDAEVQVIGPFSELKPEPMRPQLWVAGGIGIAPFLGFLNCANESWQMPIHIFHFTRASNDDSSDSITEALPLSPSQLVRFTSLETEDNKPDFTKLDQAIQEVDHPLVLVCGPPRFMKVIRKHIRSLGIPNRDIKTEEFIP